MDIPENDNFRISLNVYPIDKGADIFLFVPQVIAMVLLYDGDGGDDSSPFGRCWQLWVDDWSPQSPLMSAADIFISCLMETNQNKCLVNSDIMFFSE